MSNTFEKALDKVVNTVVDSCIKLVRSSETIDPAASHNELKLVIEANLEQLKIDLGDEPVRLPS